MMHKLPRLAAALGLLVLTGLVGLVEAQPRVDHPKLRAALHELREARAALMSAKDSWPPGYRERAMHSMDDAIRSVQTILAVKDVNTFRGVDRTPDYYQRYQDHPRLRAALQDLREARQELATARADYAGRKGRALDDIDVAIGDILTLVRYNKNAPGPRGR